MSWAINIAGHEPVTPSSTSLRTHPDLVAAAERREQTIADETAKFVEALTRAGAHVTFGAFSGQHVKRGLFESGTTGPTG